MSTLELQCSSLEKLLSLCHWVKPASMVFGEERLRITKVVRQLPNGEQARLWLGPR